MTGWTDVHPPVDLSSVRFLLKVLQDSGCIPIEAERPAIVHCNSGASNPSQGFDFGSLVYSFSRARSHKPGMFWRWVHRKQSAVWTDFCRFSVVKNEKRAHETLMSFFSVGLVRHGFNPLSTDEHHCLMQSRKPEKRAL